VPAGRYLPPGFLFYPDKILIGRLFFQDSLNNKLTNFFALVGTFHNRGAIVNAAIYTADRKPSLSKSATNGHQLQSVSAI